MSVEEIVRLIESLPEEEQRAVLQRIEAKHAEAAKREAATAMSFQQAKQHVFTTYRDVLEKLAK